MKQYMNFNIYLYWYEEFYWSKKHIFLKKKYIKV